MLHYVYYVPRGSRIFRVVDSGIGEALWMRTNRATIHANYDNEPILTTVEWYAEQVWDVEYMDSSVTFSRYQAILLIEPDGHEIGFLVREADINRVIVPNA